MVEHSLAALSSQPHKIASLPSLIKIQAQQTPNAIAITAPDRAPLTYGRLFKQVEAVAATLKTQGLGSQDRVAIVLPSGPDMAVAFLAVSCVGTSAPLPSSYPAKEFDFYFSDLCPKALLIQLGLDSPARQVARARDIPIIELSPNREEPAGVFSIEGGRAVHSVQEGNVTAHHVALVLYTSGTTSRPKMVPLTHVNIFASALNTATSLKLTEQDRCLNVMPLFHIHGLVGALLSSLVSGGCVVCAPGCNGAEFFDWLKSFSPTWYTAVPTIHQEVLKWAPDYPTHIASHQLRFIRSSSSPLPIWVMQKLEDLFKIPVIEAYGMTEAAHQIASNLLPPYSRKPGSVGRAAGPEVAIMDEVGNFLSPGFTGEIVIRGGNVMVGYEGNSVANEQAFTHKWFRTGDQGYVDTDGYFFITGRLKEILNRGGEKISPREVDDALMEHPAVDQAVTYAIPHPTLGEEVAAAVVLRQGRSITKRELQSFLVNRLAGFKVPRRFNFVREIPKGPTGKVNRMGLGDLLATQPKDTIVTPRNPVEAGVARIWEDILQIDQISIFDDFFELGGDSLQATHLISKLNQKFGKGLSWEILLQAPTVAELAKLLQEEHFSTSSSAVVPLQTDGSRAPFFCVHPVEGHVFQLRNLGFALGIDQPLYGLQARGLDGHSKPYTRVEDIATCYIEDIQAIQPIGPYYLGGLCFGGLVAFEMARQLTSGGHQVNLLALIDTYAPGYSLFWPTVRTHLWQSYKTMRILISDAKNLFRAQKPRENSQRLLKSALRKIWTRARKGWRYLSQLYLRLKGFLFVHPWRNVRHANQRACRRYRPSIYSGSATLIRAQHMHNWSYFDPQYGWGALVEGKLEICETPGYLESLVRGNRVQLLGDILRESLQTAQGEDLSLGGLKNDASQVPGETPSADLFKREERAGVNINSL